MKRSEHMIAGFAKRIVKSLAMPALIFIVFFVISTLNHVPYGTTAISWQIMIERSIASICIAYGLAVQIKNGRFDFSGGALMTLTGIMAGNLCKSLGLDGWMLIVLCVAISVAASIVIAAVYIIGKLPIIISTIGMALLFEALTNLINNGNGVSVISDGALNRFGVMPLEILIFLLAILVYYIFNTYTVSGKKAELLANNQEAAVDIGIRENKNVLQSFIVSGILYGLAAVILVSRATPFLPGVSSTLETVGTAFSTMMPVFMGFFIGNFSNDSIGILLATFAMHFLTYGIEVNTNASVRSAYTNICLGLFMLVFFLCTQQGKVFIKVLKASVHRK